MLDDVTQNAIACSLVERWPPHNSAVGTHIACRHVPHNDTATGQHQTMMPRT